ncbi:TorF family putative porin [Thiothrix lacustris]|uniref:TorF family putative porin n=1 Tax=Thiothrix lacustris TaxID=525917 RepID=UPI0027E4FCC6|nr:TorF family putative porin [Thiothrix lacustris]WMP18864.1 TorF family putative porin [Thiothrix lacustris]
MRNTQKMLATGLVALLSTTVLVPAASAGTDVSASVGVANMYLWRGYDLGKGSAVVSGDLKATHSSGAYAGIWGSSGDATLGSEYDLYAGWGGKVGALDVDASLWSYVYPSSDIGAGKLVDAVVSAGYGPVKGTLYEAVKGDDANEYRYMTLGYTKGKYSAMYGQHSYKTGDSPGHVQLGYQYNDNLSFAVSKFVVDDNNVDKDPQFLVSYSLPLTK